MSSVSSRATGTTASPSSSALQNAEAAFAQAIAAMQGAGTASQQPSPGKNGLEQGLQQDIQIGESDLAWLRNELASLQLMLSSETMMQQATSGVQRDPLGTESATELWREHGSIHAEVEAFESMAPSNGNSSRDVIDIESRIVELQARLAGLRLRLNTSVRSP
jgi:hypothetical protein